MLKNKIENKRLKATIQNKFDVEIHGLKPGATLIIDVDKDNVPISKNWRRRVSDNDGAIVMITKKKAKKS